jgi:GTP-binding protein
VIETAEGTAGDIIGVAGCEDVDIGQTIGGSATAEALPFVAIDPPTIEMQFSVNDGPLGGREGDHVTSRKIRDRLMKESKANVAIQELVVLVLS